MTTTVRITHEGPDHHDVGVLVRNGGSEIAHRLKEGQFINLYVYAGNTIEIVETAKEPA